MVEGIYLLQQHFSTVKVAWQREDQALVHAPHREDKKASLQVYRARNGNWRVHDYATDDDMWLDEYIKLHTGHSVSASSRRAVSGKPPRPQAPQVDTRASAKALLNAAIPLAEPYRKHGFTKIGDSEDAITLTKDLVHNGKVLRAGTTLFVYRDKNGEPWGIQARAERSGGGRMYWWPSKPEVAVGYSKGWRDATALVVAEGLPKAHAMARVMEEVLRNPKYLSRFGKKRPEEITVGYIAVAGKGNFKKIEEDILTWNRSLILLADHDVAAAINGKTHDSAPEGIFKDAYAKRMAVNRRTTIFAQGMLDINDLIIAHGPHVLGMLKRIQPVFHDSELRRYVLPMACDKLTPAGMQLLNAYWLYLLKHGEHKWERGWTLRGSPTRSDLAAYSGLNPQTVKVQKRKLLEAGVLQKDRYEVVLRAAALRKCLLRVPKEKASGGKRIVATAASGGSANPNAPTSSYHSLLLPLGSSLVVLVVPTPSQTAKTALLKVLATGGYRRNGHTDFGSTGVWHYAMLTLYANGWNQSQISRHLGANRRTIRRAIQRVERAVSLVRAAMREFVTRVSRFLWEMIERIRYLYDRYLQWKEGNKEAWKDAMGWLKVEARLRVHAKLNKSPGLPNVQYMSFAYA